LNPTVRALSPEEWEAFREIRLRALQTEPGVYGSSYEDARSRTEDAWRDMLAGSDRAVFGLFADGRLVGICGVFAWSDDPSRRTAIFVMDFIDRDYRGRGWSRLLFDARLDWVKQRQQFDRVHISHRDSNERIRRAIAHHGFVETKRNPHRWHDGADEEEVCYKMHIR
jgi:RimJ/RimL family protein N-acetyltransferase